MVSGLPKPSQMGSAIGWLLRRDVPASRLATLFGTSSENIRVIAFRARHSESAHSVESSLIEKPDLALARSLGIRPALDDAEWTPIRTAKLDELRNRLQTIVAGNSAKYDFVNGARKVRQILPYVGYAGDARRVAFAGLIYQHDAWFLLHSGKSASAADAARLSRNFWRVAWHESGMPEHGAGFVRAALIGAQAWLLARRPADALQLVGMADAAARAIGAKIGSDHYRQRGVALLQMTEDAAALDCFRQSARTMEKLGEATAPAQVLLTGDRHVSLLRASEPDLSQTVASSVTANFGASSLEATMARHWATAAALATDSRSVRAEALEQLERAPMPSQAFGHQATIRKLLLTTPALGLDTRLQRAWVRRALYENAFQNT